MSNAVGGAPGAEFTGDVNGELTTAGVRAGVTKEINEDAKLSGGMDFRYVRQQISENFSIGEFGFTGDDATIGTGLPTAETIDPGAYLELSTALSEDWRTAIGARLAFSRTIADPNDLPSNSSFADPITEELVEDLDVSDILGSFYLTNDVLLTPQWTTKFGFGYAERTPNLTDRYSDGLFLAVIQSGFSRVTGDPTLRKERNWQIDVRLDGEYEDFRTRFSFFNAWILDYITYAANEILDLSLIHI